MTEAQAKELKEGFSALPFKIEYREEQHGPQLVVVIACTASQEKVLRKILHELDASMTNRAEVRL